MDRFFGRKRRKREGTSQKPGLYCLLAVFHNSQVFQMQILVKKLYNIPNRKHGRIIPEILRLSVLIYSFTEKWLSYQCCSLKFELQEQSVFFEPFRKAKSSKKLNVHHLRLIYPYSFSFSDYFFCQSHYCSSHVCFFGKLY